jgi:hypothetical protein
MADDREPRFVSGEIMAAPAAAMRPKGVDVAETVDAEYETLDAYPARVMPAQAATTSVPGLGSLVDAPSASTRGGRRFWAVGIVATAGAFWAAGGHALVAAIPSGEAAAHPLRIENVSSRTEEHAGRRIVFVEGDTRNGSDHAQDLPVIAVAIVDEKGATLRYVVEARPVTLSPGERYAFASRFEAPASGVKSVSVTFREVTR